MKRTKCIIFTLKSVNYLFYWDYYRKFADNNIKRYDMSREEHSKAGFVIYLISEFARKFGIHPNQAYQYIKRHKGLEHLYKHYNVLHTFSFDDTVDCIYQVCQNNGGKL